MAIRMGLVTCTVTPVSLDNILNMKLGLVNRATQTVTPVLVQQTQAAILAGLDTHYMTVSPA